MILRGIFHVVSCFPLHFMFFRGNFDRFFNSVWRLNSGFLDHGFVCGLNVVFNQFTYFLLNFRHVTSGSCVTYESFLLFSQFLYFGRGEGGGVSCSQNSEPKQSVMFIDTLTPPPQEWKISLFILPNILMVFIWPLSASSSKGIPSLNKTVFRKLCTVRRRIRDPVFKLNFI